MTDLRRAAAAANGEQKGLVAPLAVQLELSGRIHSQALGRGRGRWDNSALSEAELPSSHCSECDATK